MPRSLSLSTITEQGKLNSNTALLQALEIGVVDKSSGNPLPIEYLHVVNNTSDIQFEGNTYVATTFDVKFEEKAGSVGSASVAINDYKRIIRIREEEYGGAIGFKVRVLLLNSADLEYADLDLPFEVTSSGWNAYTVSWNLGAENSLALPYPPYRQFKNRCRHTYKGSRCQYAGGLTTCDLSLDGPNGCEAHSNVIHFGGYPALKSN